MRGDLVYHCFHLFFALVRLRALLSMSVRPVVAVVSKAQVEKMFKLLMKAEGS